MTTEFDIALRIACDRPYKMSDNNPCRTDLTAATEIPDFIPATLRARRVWAEWGVEELAQDIAPWSDQ